MPGNAPQHAVGQRGDADGDLRHRGRVRNGARLPGKCCSFSNTEMVKRWALGYVNSPPAASDQDVGSRNLGHVFLTSLVEFTEEFAQ